MWLLLLCSCKETLKYLRPNKPCRGKNGLFYIKKVRFLLFILANTWTVCYDNTVCSQFWRSIFRLFQHLQETTYDPPKNNWKAGPYLELVVKAFLILNFCNPWRCHWRCLLNGLCKSLHVLLPHVHALSITAVTVSFKCFDLYVWKVVLHE